MVERTKAEGIEEFEGKVSEVIVEENEMDGKTTEQYHVSMTPQDAEILKNSKTGMFHEWLKIPPTATPESIPEGSVLDRFLQELEILDKSLKKATTHKEALDWLKGKSFLFKKKKLGKAFGGYEAKEYWIPVKLID